MQTGRLGNVFTGLLSGFALASGLAQYWLNCGTTLPAQTGLAAMLGLAIIVWRILNRPILSGSLANAVTLFVLSAATMLLPTMFSFCGRLVTATGIDPTTSRTAQTAYFGCVATATLLILVVSVLRMVASGSSGGSTAIGLLHGALFICPWLGPRGCGLVAAFLGLIGFVVVLIRWSRQSVSKQSETTSYRVVSNERVSTLAIRGGLIAVGLLWVTAQRMERQIVPESFIFSMVEFAMLLGGLAFGSKHPSQQPQRILTLGAITVAAGSWLCLAAVPMWTWLALQENVHLSQVWLLWPLRLGLILPVLAPLAIFNGQLMHLGRAVLAPQSDSECTGGRPPRSPVSALVLIAAMVSSMWLLPSLGVWWLTLIGSSILVALAALCCDWSQVWDEVDRLVTLRNWRKWRFVGALILVGFAITAPVWVRYQPADPARLLFDGNVFAAHRQRTPWEQLPAIDEARVAFVSEADNGTLTAWKLRGSTFLIRENGIPKGSFASRPQLAPRYLPEVLATVLPMTVFNGPQSVLLLGVRGGEPLATVAAFPLQRVLAIEPDRGVSEFARRLLSESGSLAVSEDSWFETRICEPTLALQTLREKFDVILASPNQPSLPSAAIGFTAESLRAAGSCLTNDGVLAIRFSHADLGPRPIRVLAKTLSSVFAHVAAIEMVPGELLFVATNSLQGLARDGFVERLQRPQVRELLASCGWDWSSPLRLGLQDADAIAAWAGHRDGAINEAANSTWPFRLPTEVMKWDSKIQQVRAELQKHERFLMAWGGPDAETADVATRLSEWDLSRQVVRRHADEFWAYRKQVKDHMTKSPRSMIQQVGLKQTESGLHPDDERRLRYFRTLGDVSKRPHPTAADFDRIRQYETPFDPLVTPFLHGEIAELSPRCEPRDIANELRHRLASVNFTAAGDRSIRNVTDALEFLNTNPDALPDAAERFDQINSLLQTLLHRWHARGTFKPISSKVALNDIERSISAAESTFVTCDAIAATQAVCPVAWHARQTFIDRQLVRRLRTYRSDVLAHFIKTEQTKAELKTQSE